MVSLPGELGQWGDAPAWRRLDMSESRIFDEALQIPDPDRRSAFVADACGADQELRARVDRLLRISDSSVGLLERPAVVSLAGLERRSERELRPGEFIGPYRLVRERGRGGMAVVWEAWQAEPFNRPVAVKLLEPLAVNPRAVQRLEAEGQALAGMNHPCVATVFDAGQTAEGDVYLVMELVEGLPLTAFCARENLDVRQRIELLVQVCQGVQHAHQRGFVHRDLKPSNLLAFRQDGAARVKVIDFGIAKLLAAEPAGSGSTRTGLIVGTPEYMSPEQATFEPGPADTRSDVWSTGVVMYELLSGRLPFDRDRLRRTPLSEIFRLLREEPVPRPSQQVAAGGPRSTRIDRELDWITMRALARDPDQRYASMEHFAEDLGHWLAGLPVSAGPPTLGYRLGSLARRYRKTVIASMAMLLALVAATVISVVMAIRAGRAEEKAVRSAGESDAAKRLAEQRLVESERQRAAATEARRTADQVKQYLTAMFRSVHPDWDGKDVRVTTVLERAIATIDRDFPDDPTIRAELKAVFGEALSGLGMWAEAIGLLEASEKELRSANAPASSRRYAAQALQGLLHGRMGQPAKGLRQLDMVIEGLAGFPDAQRELLLARRSRVELLARSGQLETAIRLAESLPAEFAACFGPEHADTLLASTSLVNSYLQAGRLDAADPLMVPLVEQLERLYGADHPQTTSARGNLAFLRIRQGRLEEARTTLEQVLAALDRHLDEKHPQYLDALNNHAAVLLMQGDLVNGLPAIRRVASLRAEVLGAEHPDSLAALGNVITAEVQLDGLAAHLEAASDCRARLERALGADEPRVLDYLHRIADRARRDPADDELVRWARQALTARRGSLGPDHLLTLETQLVLADIQLERREPADAQSTARNLVDRASRTLGGEHPLTCKATGTLAIALFRLGQIHEAVELADAVLKSQRRILGNSHPDTQATLVNLGGFKLVDGQPAEASELLEEALRVLPTTDAVPSLDRLAIQNTLNWARFRSGQREGLEPEVRDWLGQAELADPAQRALAVSARQLLAEILLVGEKTAEAMPLVELNLIEAETAHGPKSHPGLLSRITHGEVLSARGDYAAAAQIIGGVEGELRAVGSFPPDLPGDLETRLTALAVQVYAGLNDDAQLERWRARQAPMPGRN